MALFTDPKKLLNVMATLNDDGLTKVKQANDEAALANLRTVATLSPAAWIEACQGSFQAGVLFALSELGDVNATYRRADNDPAGTEWRKQVSEYIDSVRSGKAEAAAVDIAGAYL